MKWRYRILGWGMTFFDVVTIVAFLGMGLALLLTSCGLL
jgi:hypothetical protein